MDSMAMAPELQCTQWFNTEVPVTLAALRGKVVVIEAFQMLCPGCVSHGLPQVQKMRHVFPEDRVAVLGLHTVFEHHTAMAPVALQVFLHEYRIQFPVGVDMPADTGPIPHHGRLWHARYAHAADHRLRLAACGTSTSGKWKPTWRWARKWRC